MVKEAFRRTEIMLGQEGLARLEKSFVVVAGAGAVGGYVLEALVRAGVGHIRIVDYDKVEETNLNRQILATRETLGRAKVDLAKERAVSINPDVKIDTLKVLISPENMNDVLGGNPDLLIDAIDTVSAKITLLKTAVMNNIPVLSSMGAALRTDTDKIRVAPLSETKVCPLSRLIRNGLKKENIDIAEIMTVFSEEQVSVTPCQRDNAAKSILGSLPTIPAIFGLVLANLAILRLTQGEKGED